MENLLLLKKENKMLKKKNSLDNEAEEILCFLEDIKLKLEYTELCLNFESDHILIDSLIYEMMSLQKKYEYYLKLSKKKGIVINCPKILKQFTA